MKPAKIRVYKTANNKTVEVIHKETAYLITASEPRQLMREARKFAKVNGYHITDIIYI